MLVIVFSAKPMAWKDNCTLDFSFYFCKTWHWRSIFQRRVVTISYDIYGLKKKRQFARLVLISFIIIILRRSDFIYLKRSKGHLFASIKSKISFQVPFSIFQVIWNKTEGKNGKTIKLKIWTNPSSGQSEDSFGF